SPRQRPLAHEFRTLARRCAAGRTACAPARRLRRAAVGNLAVAVAGMSVQAAVVPPDHAAGAPWLPPEAPLEMPVQDLHAGTLAHPRLPSTPPSIVWRRAFVFGGTAGLTLLAAYQLWWLMRGDGIVVL